MVPGQRWRARSPSDRCAIHPLLPLPRCSSQACQRWNWTPPSGSQARRSGSSRRAVLDERTGAQSIIHHLSVQPTGNQPLPGYCRAVYLHISCLPPAEGLFISSPLVLSRMRRWPSRYELSPLDTRQPGLLTHPPPTYETGRYPPTGIFLHLMTVPVPSVARHFQVLRHGFRCGAASPSG